ncbi:MAG: hypothetical protein K2R98_13120 [Gemmataceae bacterium]|nr:hypothetical protein [Gemmataceae bacterium]
MHRSMGACFFLAKGGAESGTFSAPDRPMGTDDSHSAYISGRFGSARSAPREGCIFPGKYGVFAARSLAVWVENSTRNDTRRRHLEKSASSLLPAPILYARTAVYSELVSTCQSQEETSSTVFAVGSLV